MQSGWRYARDIYGALGGTDRWDWARVSGDPARFRAWLAANQNTLKTDGIVRRFGNHRKYQSLEDQKPNGTGAAVQSYVAWVGPPRTHEELFRDALVAASGDERQAFARLYRSMTAVVSVRPDGEVRLPDDDRKTRPRSDRAGLHLHERSDRPSRWGPPPLPRESDRERRHAPGSSTDGWCELEAQLGVGMQVLEDSLCNWQKSPDDFRRFRG